MRVKQRLKVNVIISAMAVLAVIAVLFLSIHRINLAMEESDLAGLIRNSAFEGSTFKADYLRTNSERAKKQWFARHEQVGKLLKIASERLKDADDKIVVDDMITDHESETRLYSGIVENREKLKSGQGPAELSRELENRLVTQENIRLYDKVLDARALREAADRRLSSILSLAGWSIFLVVAALAAAAVINAWTMSRTIADRIGTLRDGASVIGGGDLEHRIDIKGDDEFAELSGAFNAMTGRLQGFYHELEQENNERKRAEGALRASEGEYRSLFENMLHGFAHCRMLYDESGRPSDFIYLNVNNAFKNLTTLADVVGKKVTEVIPGIKEAHPELFEIYGRVALTGQPERLEIEFKPLEIWLSIAVYSPGREHFVAIFDNISERKKYEQEVLKLSETMAARNLELESANREMESFIYSVSHDLRAPLRSISSFSKIILEDYPDKLDAQGRDYLARIHNGSEKMTRLINDLLHLSKLSRQELDRMDFDLGKLAENVVQGLCEACPGRNVEISIAEGLRAFVDPNLMRLVFMNLLDNALKFTSKTEKARIEFSQTVRDGKTVYYVKDNGAGFDPTYADKMFWPFHRLHTDKEFEGSGIGLAIVDRIIRRHGGQVWAEGNVGKGAMVYFTLG